MDIPKYNFASLKELVQYRFKTDVVEKAFAANGEKGALAVLILDDYTISIIGETIPMTKLTEWGVTAVVNIKYTREPIRLVPIYYLSPCEASVNALIADWDHTRYQQYNIPVHAFFSGMLDQSLIDKIVNAKVASYLKTFASVSMFKAYGHNLFTVDAPDNILNILYHEPNPAIRHDVMKKMAQQIASMFIMFRMNPQIVYSASSPNAICSDFKTYVANHYKTLKESAENYVEEEERPLLMIIDRGLDPLSPVMYELHYEALIYDILDVTPNDTITTEKIGKFALSEGDAVWEDSRFRHIGDVSVSIPKQLADLKETNAAMKFHELKKKGVKLTADDYMAALRDQSDYKEKTGALQAHVDIVNNILDALMKGNIIRELIELQQDIATQVDEACQDVKVSSLTKAVQKELHKDRLDEYQAIRLLMAFVMGVPTSHAQSRGSFFQMAKTSPTLQQAYNNLAKLGVDLREGQFRTLRIKQAFVKHYAKLQKSGFVRRHVPLLFFHLNEAIKGKLNNKHFKWEGRKTDAPFIPANELPQSFRIKDDKKAEEQKKAKEEWPKVFVFILGGATRSEIRIADEVAKHYDHNVFLGSSKFWKPQEFVDALAEMTTHSKIDVKAD